MSTTQSNRSAKIIAACIVTGILAAESVHAQFGSPILPPEVVKRNTNQCPGGTCDAGLCSAESLFPGRRCGGFLDSATDGPHEDNYVHVVMDLSGYWVGVWQEGGGTIVYVRSSGGTCTAGFCEGGIHISGSKPCIGDSDCQWTATQPILNVPDGLVDYSPYVATDGQGNWIATYGSSTFTGGGQPGGLMAMRSGDNGATWQGPATVAADPAGPPLGFQNTVVVYGQGAWVAVWENSASVPDPFTNPGGQAETDIFFSRSTDNGLTWSPPATLNTDAATDIGATHFMVDSTPWAATDGNGNWIAVWNRSGHPNAGGCCQSGDRIAYATSEDNGATWSAPATLSTEYACNINQYPRIATDKAGTWITAWNNRCGAFANPGEVEDYDVLYSRSTDNGSTWTTAAPINSWALSDTGSDFYPVVAADAYGNWLVTWHSFEDHAGSGTDADIWVARSADYGVSWTQPALLNTNGTTDSGHDALTTFGTDQRGNWIVLWEGSSVVNEGSGPDTEALLARFATPDCNSNFESDTQDIVLGASADQDGNGIPDECQGSPVVDCNENEIEDSVDLLSGRSSDCDGNGNLDECDSANCATSSCGNCNNNNLLDGCDIALGLSNDALINDTGAAGTDGIPDECVNDSGGGSFRAELVAGGCGNNWSCGDNWNLAGSYPNNDGAARFSVVFADLAAAATSGMDGSAAAGGIAELVVDVDVTIDSLLMGPTSRLSLTQAGPAGNMEVLRSGMYSRGETVMAAGRSLATSAFTLEGATAVYRGVADAALRALDINLYADAAAQTAGGGGPVLELRDNMTASALRDVYTQGAIHMSEGAALEAAAGMLHMAAGSALAENPGSASNATYSVQARDLYISGANNSSAQAEARLGDDSVMRVTNRADIAGRMLLSGAASFEMPAMAGIEGAILAAGASVLKDPAATGYSTASFSAPSLSISGATTSPAPNTAAQMILSDDMSVTVTVGDLVCRGNIFFDGDSQIEVTNGQFVLAGNGVFKASEAAVANTERTTANVAHFFTAPIFKMIFNVTHFARGNETLAGGSLERPLMELTGQMAVESQSGFSILGGTLRMADDVSLTVLSGAYDLGAGAIHESVSGASALSAPTVEASEVILRGPLDVPVALPAALMRLDRNAEVTATTGDFVLDGGILEMSGAATARSAAGDFLVAARSQILSVSSFQSVAAGLLNTSELSSGDDFIINGQIDPPNGPPAALVERRDQESLTAGGDVLLNGDLRVGEQAAVTAGADFVAAGRATYEAAADAAADSVASASAARIFIQDSASVVLSLNMRLDSTGALQLVGLTASRAAMGIAPPPRLNLDTASEINVAGAMVMSGIATSVNSSSVGVALRGDFEQNLVMASAFDWSDGAMKMNGTVPQIFEVAGLDLGASYEGFLTDADTLFDSQQHKNFSMESLEIAAGADVTMSNGFANSAGTGACQEALYVQTLVLRSGSSLTIADCNVYANTILREPGAEVVFSGCGQLHRLAPGQPYPDPTGIQKTRFISFSADPSTKGEGAESAIRVVLTSLHHVSPPYPVGPSIPFTSLEGQVRWVGPPATYLESNSSGIPFVAASLQCTPHYQDWSTIELLHVTGSAIVPSSMYEVAFMGAVCMGIEDSCEAVSARLSIATTRWGDVEIPYNPPSTTAQPDVGDISALVNKFRSAIGAPIKARALLTGADGFGNVNIAPDLSFGHIAACVDAFRGQGYPFTISSCP